ncbi:MAG: PAS domain S-box protein, partial [FCB group bacterium]|nr:PAS domain S-box protein [FCB group bacterium]
MEEALRKSEERYKGIIRYAASGIAVYNSVDEGKDFVFVDFNPSAEKADKISKEDVIGKKVTDVFPGVKEFGLFKVFQNVWKTGKPQHFPVSVYKDKRIQGYRENFVYKLSSGEIVAVYNDLTEQKQAEVALKKSESLYHDLVDASQDLIWQCDAEGKYTYLNSAWKEVFGYNIEEMLGRSFSDFQTPEYAESDLKEFKRLLKGNTVKGLETVHLGKSGNEINLVFNAKFVTDDNGKIAGTRGTAYDITKRKLAEEKIYEQHIFLNSIMESLTHPFYVINTHDYSIKIANTASGFNLTEKKTTCHRVTHNSDKPCQEPDHPCPMEKVKKTKKSTMIEHVHFDENGTPRNIEVHCYPIFDNEGNVIQVIEYCLDITERKQAEMTLEKSEKSLIKAQEIAHMGSWEWDIKTDKITWSDEVYRIYDIEPETKLTYDIMMERIHPDDRDWHNKNTSAWIENQEGVPYEYRVMHRDNSIRHIHGICEVVSDEFDKPVKLMG